jgi:hypothetical protein
MKQLGNYIKCQFQTQVGAHVYVRANPLFLNQALNQGWRQFRMRIEDQVLEQVYWQVEEVLDEAVRR